MSEPSRPIGLRTGRLPGNVATHDEAWIGHAHVTPTQLTAEVDRSALDGAELELFGVAERSIRKLSGPTTVTFPLQQGLPKSAWLWLKRGTT